MADDPTGNGNPWTVLHLKEHPGPCEDVMEAAQ